MGGTIVHMSISSESRGSAFYGNEPKFGPYLHWDNSMLPQVNGDIQRGGGINAIKSYPPQ